MSGLITFLRRMFPDLQTKFQSIVAKGDKVAMMWTAPESEGQWEPGTPAARSKVERRRIGMNKIDNGEIKKSSVDGWPLSIPRGEITG